MTNPPWDHKRRETATEALDRVHVGTITGRGTVRIVLLGRTLIVPRESLTGGRNSRPMTRRVFRCAIVTTLAVEARGRTEQITDVRQRAGYHC
jgi:hypothetical protein